MQILLADGDSRLVSRLHRVLERTQPDWQIIPALSGESALQSLQAQRIHLIICGEELGDQTGIDLLRSVRDNHPEVLRFLLTQAAKGTAVTSNGGLVHRYLSRSIEDSQLQATVERSATLFKLIQNSALSDLLANVGALPAVPTDTQQVLDALKDPDTSLRDMGELVAQDPSMTAQVLRFVNSAYVGINASITKPQQAVVLLGLDVTRSLIMAAKLLSTFQNPDANKLAEDVYQHSFYVGLFARMIAAELGADADIQDDAIITGTLHDVGKLILVTYVPELWQRCVDMAEERGISLHQVEHSMLGVSHAEVGGYWLGISGLDDRIVQAVTYHHTPLQAPDSGSPLLESIHVANVYANRQDEAARAEIEAAEQQGLLDLAYVEQQGHVDQLPRWQALCLLEKTAGDARPARHVRRTTAVPQVATPPRRQRSLLGWAKSLFS